MTLKTFVTETDAIFTVADLNSNVIGGAGTQTVRLQQNADLAGGIFLDANIENIEFRGQYSDYKFVVISNTGLEIQNAKNTYGTIGTVIATLPSTNQDVKLKFTDGYATLHQADTNSFTLNTVAVTVGATGDATTPDLSGNALVSGSGNVSTVTYTDGTAVTQANTAISKAFVTGGTSNTAAVFTVADHNVLVKGDYGLSTNETVRIQADVTGVKLDANIERVELSGALATYKFLATVGTGLRIYETDGTTLVATIPSINQDIKIAFTDGSATLAQTGGADFTLNTVAIDKNTATTPDLSNNALVTTSGNRSVLGLHITNTTVSITDAFNGYVATSGTSANAATVLATNMNSSKMGDLVTAVNKIANDGITGLISLTGDQFTSLTAKLHTDATLTATDATLAATVLTAMDTKATPAVVAIAVSTITGSASDVASVANATDITKATDFAVTLSGTNATGTELHDINLATTGLVNASSVTTITGFAAADYLDIGGSDATSNNVKTNAAVEITLTDTTTTGVALKHLNSKTTGLVDASAVSAITVFDAADYSDIGGSTASGDNVKTNAAVEITLTDTTTTGAALKALNLATTGLVDASAVTAITDFPAADYADIGGSTASGDNVKTKAAVEITLTNTTTTGTALKAIDDATSGLVDASLVTAITALDALNFALVGGTSGTAVKTKSDVAVTLSNATVTMTGGNLKTLDDNTTGLVDASTLTSITDLAATDYGLIGGVNFSNNGVKTKSDVVVTFAEEISAANVNTVDVLTTGLVTATVTADTAATVNNALTDTVDVDALTITVTDTSVDATVLKALDAKTSVDIIDSNTIVTLTGSTVADFVTVLTAGATAGLAGTEAATVDGTILAAAADSIAALTSGIVTATVTTNTASALNTDLATTYDGNDALTLTLTDTTGTTITQLNSLDGKTGVAVVATTLTEVNGTAGIDTIDLTNSGITYHATDMISIKGGEGDDILTGRVNAGDTFVIPSNSGQIITINDFNGTNDTLSFFEGAILNVTIDSDDNDNEQLITATNPLDGAVTTVKLTGLTIAQDTNLFNMASFNTLFAKTGRTGNDVINGTAGIDTMTGDTGTDTFVLASKAHAGTYTGTDTDATKIDRITDFTVADDTIQLSTAANVFGTSLQFTSNTTMNVATAVPLADADYADLAAVMTALQNVSAGAASDATTAQAIVVTVATKSASDTAGDFDTLAAGTYLIINDAAAAWTAADTIINISGLNGVVAGIDFTFV